MSIEVASASVPMIPALSPGALEARATRIGQSGEAPRPLGGIPPTLLSAAPSLFPPAGFVPALAGAPHRKFLDLGSFVVLLFELGHHRFLFFRGRVSHFFGGGSRSLVTAVDFLHDMVVALFSYLFK
jgi:hypothetical protein